MIGFAHWRLAVSLAAAAVPAAVPATVASRSDAWRPIGLSELCVSEGHVTPSAADMLSVDDTKMRAIIPASASAIEARFRYLGPTAQTSPLGSGEVRRQFGLKLRAQDPCNLVYAMWRFEPKPEIVVQVKSNPGEHESSACGNNGYITVRPDQVSPVAAPAVGAPHRLAASVRGASLQVQVDGATAWQGDLGGEPVAATGEVGIRSDNVRLALSLSAPLPDVGVGACPTGPQD
jgi:hypothetical protein